MPGLQGFIQYRLSGEALHLDVDTLNERLKLKGAARMRLAMRPDEAYGMIFNWDGVLANVKQVSIGHIRAGKREFIATSLHNLGCVIRGGFDNIRHSCS